MSKIKMRIAELRKSKGLTQQELADTLNVSSQCVSKWENGISMPDINLIPEICEVFKVSSDQLLGLKPLDDEIYHKEETGTKEFWNKKLNYLKNTRREFFNTEYINYLINEVWQISKPIDILDCGCGFGYLGLSLLPLLPEGSTYTGIDFSEELISYANKVSAESPLNYTFIQKDFFEFNTAKKYDLVIEQAVLRHLDNGESFLKKMISHAKCNGLIVCMEVNREFESDGLYVDGLDYMNLCNNSGLKKKWKMEFEKQGRDYAIAMRVPDMMYKIGLKCIDVRMNDRVSYITPEDENYNEIKSNFIEYKDFNTYLNSEKSEEIVKLLISKGLDRKEAEDYCNKNCSIAQTLYYDSSTFLSFKGEMIITGRKSM